MVRRYVLPCPVDPKDPPIPMPTLSEAEDLLLNPPNNQEPMAIPTVLCVPNLPTPEHIITTTTVEELPARFDHPTITTTTINNNNNNNNKIMGAINQIKRNRQG